jgi:hypothetical protein
LLLSDFDKFRARETPFSSAPNLPPGSETGSDPAISLIILLHPTLPPK